MLAAGLGFSSVSIAFLAVDMISSHCLEKLSFSISPRVGAAVGGGGGGPAGCAGATARPLGGGGGGPVGGAAAKPLEPLEGRGGGAGISVGLALW